MKLRKITKRRRKKKGIWLERLTVDQKLFYNANSDNKNLKKKKNGQKEHWMVDRIVNKDRY